MPDEPDLPLRDRVTRLEERLDAHATRSEDRHGQVMAALEKLTKRVSAEGAPPRLVAPTTGFAGWVWLALQLGGPISAVTFGGYELHRISQDPPPAAAPARP